MNAPIGPKRERNGDRERHLQVGAVKLLADGSKAVDHQEIVESVKRPTEKARDDRSVLIGRDGSSREPE